MVPGRQQCTRMDRNPTPQPDPKKNEKSNAWSCGMRILARVARALNTAQNKARPRATARTLRADRSPAPIPGFTGPQPTAPRHQAPPPRPARRVRMAGSRYVPPAMHAARVLARTGAPARVTVQRALRPDRSAARASMVRGRAILPNGADARARARCRLASCARAKIVMRSDNGRCGHHLDSVPTATSKGNRVPRVDDRVRPPGLQPTRRPPRHDTARAACIPRARSTPISHTDAPRDATYTRSNACRPRVSKTAPVPGTPVVSNPRGPSWSASVPRSARRQK